MFGGALSDVDIHFLELGQFIAFICIVIIIYCDYSTMVLGCINIDYPCAAVPVCDLPACVSTVGCCHCQTRHQLLSPFAYDYMRDV